MSNLRLLPSSHADSPVLYATSTEALYSVSNLQIGQPSLKWRSSSAADQQLWSKFDAASVCSGMVLYQHNLSADGTIRLALYNKIADNTITNAVHAAGVVTITTNTAHGLDDAIANGVWITGVVGMTDLNNRLFDIVSVPTGDTFTISLTTAQTYTSGGAVELCETMHDETDVAFEPRYGLGDGPLGVMGLGGFSIIGADPSAKAFWFDSVTATHMLVELFDSGNDDGYLEAGRLMIESYWTPTVNFDHGSEFGHQDDSEIYRSRGGTLHSDDRPSYRTFGCTFSFLDEQDSIEFHDVLGLVGKRGDVFLSAFPESTDPVKGATEIYGKIADYSRMNRERHGYGVSINIEENL